MRAIAISLMLLAGCNTPDNCGIYSGTIVKSKLDGRTGMVLRAWEFVPQVEVRFAAGQMTTDTHTLGSDGPVEFSPYADVIMQCFEFEVVK